MFHFEICFGHEIAVADVSVKMATVQLSALFDKHFYIASGFCLRTL